jgi:phosphatidate cytidylyltransferase
MLGVVEARPVVNVALTLMAFVWVGMLGSYGALLLRAHHGSNVLLLAILATVAADVMAYAAGRTLGSRPLAPHISPGKTWEGVIVGGIGAVVVAIIIGKGFMSSTFTIRHALLLGLVVAVVGPIGDLTESMVKRDLDLKDSGTLLPGHGGLLDRFDALLFVLPATFYLATYLNLLK